VDEVPEAAAPSGVGAPLFAHASEAELARILDYYGIEWQYEPTAFPILWNLDGNVVESFSPDYYLPEFDLYVELTTLKQSLVRKKNRKLRRLRELYPDIRVKLLYARDFRALMMKYGRLGLLDSLSGTEGQVIVVHDTAPPGDTAAAPSRAPAGTPRSRMRRRHAAIASEPAGAAEALTRTTERCR
jgi:hypoxanthine phosphoribosyltransferase